MEISDKYKDDYQRLRKELFDLKYKLSSQIKLLTDEEIIVLRTEINEVKKAIAHLLYLSKNIETESVIQGGMNK